MHMKKKIKSAEQGDVPHVHSETDEHTHAEGNRNRTNTILNILIVVCLLVVVVLGGLIAFSGKSESKPVDSTPKREEEKLTTHSFDSLTIKANMDKEGASLLNAFATKTILAPMLSKEVLLRSMPQGKIIPDGETYVGGWNKDGKYISLLYATSADKKSPAYLRIWYMPSGETVDKTQAEKLLAELFSQEFLTEIGGPLACQKVKAPDGTDITECVKMKSRADGSLVGVTVRAPIILQPPPGVPSVTGLPAGPKVIAVSACMVPKEETSTYAAPSCI